MKCEHIRQEWPGKDGVDLPCATPGCPAGAAGPCFVVMRPPKVPPCAYLSESPDPKTFQALQIVFERRCFRHHMLGKPSTGWGWVERP